MAFGDSLTDLKRYLDSLAKDQTVEMPEDHVGTPTMSQPRPVDRFSDEPNPMGLGSLDPELVRRALRLMSQRPAPTPPVDDSLQGSPEFQASQEAAGAPHVAPPMAQATEDSSTRQQPPVTSGTTPAGGERRTPEEFLSALAGAPVKEATPTDVGRPMEPAPRDPFQYAAYARGEDAKIGDALLANAEQKRINDQAAANEIADEAQRQAIIEEETQRKVEQRQEQLRQMRGASIERQRRGVIALATAATDVGDLYPHPQNAHTAIGNALLALSTGAGADAAAQILIKSSEGDQEWDKMSVERHRALVDGLTRAVGAMGDETRTLGGAMVDEAQVNNAMTQARKEMYAKRLEAFAAQHQAEAVGQQAEAAAQLIRRDNLKNGQEWADAEVKSYLTALQLWKAGQPKVAGIPGPPPQEPVLGEKGHEGESDEAFNMRYSYWQNVAIPQWSAKMRSAGTVTGTASPAPRPPWMEHPSLGLGQTTPTKAVPRKLSVSDFRKGTKGKAKQPAAPAQPTTQTEPSATDVWQGKSTETPADKSRARLWGIPLSSGEQLVPLRGKTPDMTSEGAQKFRNSVATIESVNPIIEKIAAYAAGKEDTLRDLVANKIPGINMQSSRKQNLEALRSWLIFQISGIQGQGVVREGEMPLYQNMVSDSFFYNDDPSAAVNGLLQLSQTLNGRVQAELRANGYNTAPFDKIAERSQDVIRGMNAPVKGNKDSSKAAGEAARKVAEDRDWAGEQLARGQYALPPEVKPELVKLGDEPHAKNDAGRWAVPYQSIADKQIGINQRASEYAQAMKTADWGKAHVAFNELQKLKADQAKDVRGLLDSLPEDTFRSLGFDTVDTSGPRPIVMTRRTWTKSQDADSLRPFVQRLIASGGSILGGN